MVGFLMVVLGYVFSNYAVLVCSHVIMWHMSMCERFFVSLCILRISDEEGDFKFQCKRSWNVWMTCSVILA